MSEEPKIAQFETEGEFTKRVREEMQVSIFDAARISRKQVLVREIWRAEDLHDIKNLLERIVTGA